MRRIPPSLPPLGAGLAAAWIAMGCGTKTIDQARAQDYIKANLTKKGVPNPAVSCPSGVAVHAGRTFDCTAVSGGQRVIFTLRMRDASGTVDVVSFRQG